MSPLAGVLFLVVGIGVFLVSVVFLAWRESRGHKPTRTVEHFRRSHLAMRNLYRAQVARREAARARARALHPAAQRRRHDRRSA